MSAAPLTLATARVTDPARNLVPAEAWALSGAEAAVGAVVEVVATVLAPILVFVAAGAQIWAAAVL